MRIEEQISKMAAAAFAKAFERDVPPVVRKSQDEKHGDFQLNGVLPLAKQEKKNPRELAERVAALLVDAEAFERVEVAGPGFINLSLRPSWIAAQLKDIATGKTPSISAVEKKETIVVDFSGPNIAKQMHVGHIRSTIIGAAIVRLLRAIGHEVIGDNHVGDWGTQFGLLIAGMAAFGDAKALEDNAIEELERIYKLASARAKEDTAFAEVARSELAKLQNGDAQNLAMWKRFADTTKKSLDVVYERLGITFDTWLGESTFNDMLAGVAEDLEKRGIARKNEGALCVFFGDHESAPADLRKIKEPFIVRKSDGAFLYSTTDIATAYYRRDTQKATRSVYVVDSRQGLHFKQLFAVLKLLGFEGEFVHVGFGSILGEDGKPLKTRDGGTVKLASVLDEAEERAGARIREEGLEVSPDELARTTSIVGLGAVKYADLRQNRLSDYVFDWDKMISFKGNAGPYLQYAYARIQSVFRKGEVDKASLDNPTELLLDAPEERALAKTLLRFGDVVHAAAETYQPHLLCDHLYGLARDFSSFYEACSILKAEGNVRASRLTLTDLTGKQLASGLHLLGIGTVDRM